MKQALKFILYCSVIVTICFGFCSLSKLYEWLNTPAIDFAWEDVFIESKTLPFIRQRGDINDGYGCLYSPLYSGCRSGFISKTVSYYSSEGREKANEDIGYYLNENKALNDYSTLKASWFYKYSNETDFSTPKEIEYKSQVADEYFLACNTNTDTEETQCKMIGRYKKFIVLFIMYGKPVNFELFEQAVMAIDKKISYYATKF